MVYGSCCCLLASHFQYEHTHTHPHYENTASRSWKLAGDGHTHHVQDMTVMFYRFNNQTYLLKTCCCFFTIICLCKYQMQHCTSLWVVLHSPWPVGGVVARERRGKHHHPEGGTDNAARSKANRNADCFTDCVRKKKNTSVFHFVRVKRYTCGAVLL